MQQSITYLKKAIALGFDALEWLKTDDSMDGLREKFEFIEIMEQLERVMKK